ncbi:hypothetical protein HQO42_23075 [Rhodococcus fascians]|nr:hypothetical protein [Rhodococcus fascians]MBY4239936.1 hypothetical protein [Rhodococcus fascians]MBY4255540.1 hypothetical protein [Rhodococcus fascians]MBY4271269.1 hypothetical protein [Rhodococcus fascians]
MTNEVASDERKVRTTLRLATARLFTLRLRDEKFRESFAVKSGWTPTSPVVPCEFDTLFGEVHRTAVPALQRTDAAVVAIPVLHVDREFKKLSMVVLTMGSDDRRRDAYSSIGIDSINHNVTMEQLCQTLSPNKKWDVRDLDQGISKTIIG